MLIWIFFLIFRIFRSTPETSDEDEDNSEGMTEIRFVPEDKSKLQEMFNAMSRCQALHPDPEAAEDQEDEDEAEHEADEAGDEGIFDDAEEDYENGDGHERMDES